MPGNPDFWELSYKVTAKPWLMLPEVVILVSVSTSAVVILDKFGLWLKLGSKKKPVGFFEGLVVCGLGIIFA